MKKLRVLIIAGSLEEYNLFIKYFKDKNIEFVYVEDFNCLIGTLYDDMWTIGLGHFRKDLKKILEYGAESFRGFKSLNNNNLLDK